ncbi:MAG: DEAD/DEAH box helicase [Ignavibacteria bacterium]|nr:DEAD/DEAH box helicase [Ignavibacteria bacterium]
MGFTIFGLSDQLLQGVRDAGYSVPTPIQSLTIGPVLEGKDVIGCAQTGTGKTAAFVLPILHRLSAVKPAGRRMPRALVLTPTRELAQQVQDAVREYGRRTPIRSVAVYGGVGMEPQISLFRKGVDIIVATPGRLIDHMERGTVDLSKIETVVLDEADRMLDMGFIKDMKKILHRLPEKRQTLLFSATFSNEIASLSSQFLRDPEKVSVGERRNPAESVTQHFYAAQPGSKAELLRHIIEKEAMESVLVFSRTKHGADKIARRLEKSGVSTTTLHSNRTQGQRQRSLDGFKAGRYRVLVATDIAARGIDVDGISHVVNYDIPQYAEDYIHRIGRTGRAGATGDAITLVGPAERQYLRRIESFIGKQCHVKGYAGFSPSVEKPISGNSGRPVSNESRPVATGNGRSPHGPRRGHSRTKGPQDRNPRHPSAKPPRRRDGKAAAKPGRSKRRGFDATAAPPRKKKQPRKLDSFSSDGAAWSNY